MSRQETQRPEGGRLISTSNDRERPLMTYRDLPTAVRTDFDYLKDSELDEYRFVRFRGEWYDVNDCDGLAPDMLKAHGWNAYASDSFFSGVVFRHFDTDGNHLDDTVVCGRYWVED